MAATDAATSEAAARDAAESDSPRAPPARPQRADATPHAGALLAAALALPGIVPAVAHAQAAPDQGLFELQYLSYRDWQPGRNRMKVDAPAFYALLPVSDTLAVEGGIVYDAMSGASPLFYSTLSGASIGDYRTAGDIKVTKYFGDYAVSLGGAVSREQDFLSRAVSVNVQVFTDDRNRTWNFGVAGTNDQIDSTNGIAVAQKRNTADFVIGVTQALSSNAIVQTNLTYSTGHGYYSDPYKSLDNRPSTRQTYAWLTRLNYRVPAYDATLKLGYRLLFDSFGSTSSTFDIAWAQALPYGFTVTPGLRYHTQNSADFYFNPPFPRGYVDGQHYTADTRLAGFGGLTAGVVVGKTLWDGWRVSFRGDFYRQDPDWRLDGSGSPGIKTFSARWLEFNLGKTF